MRFVLAAVVFVTLIVVGTANAAPIVYAGVLVSGTTTPGTLPVTSTFDDPETADFWSFFAAAGDTVTITGHRQEAQLDPGFWLFQGLFADTTSFGGSFDGADPGFIAFQDDDIPEFPFIGPFSDPQFVGVLPTTGFYTVAFVSVSSAGPQPGSPGYDYTLLLQPTGGAAPVPEPTSLLLFGTGAAGLIAKARRRKKRQPVQ